RADDAVASRPVVLDHLLAPALCQLLRDQTPQRIHTASRWKRDDDANRSAGVGLLCLSAAQDDEQADCENPCNVIEQLAGPLSCVERTAATPAFILLRWSGRRRL